MEVCGKVNVFFREGRWPKWEPFSPRELLTGLSTPLLPLSLITAILQMWGFVVQKASPHLESKDAGTHSLNFSSIALAACLFQHSLWCFQLPFKHHRVWHLPTCLSCCTFMPPLNLFGQLLSQISQTKLMIR